MKTKMLKPWLLVLGLFVLLTACGTLAFPAKREVGLDIPATPQEIASGAEVWANNCRRCHNFRSPASLTDSQWEVVMLHMRVRANLTGAEHRAVLAFLKSGN